MWDVTKIKTLTDALVRVDSQAAAEFGLEAYAYMAGSCTRVAFRDAGYGVRLTAEIRETPGAWDSWDSPARLDYMLRMLHTTRRELLDRNCTPAIPPALA